MAKLPSNAYWNARAEQRMDGYLQGSEQTLRIIGSAFQRATQTMQEDVERIYGAYARRHQLTPDEAKAYLAQPAPYAEYERLLAQLPGVTDAAQRQALLARINAPAAAYRMSRLEALQADVALQVGRAAEVQTDAAAAGFQRTIQDAYGRTLYDIQRGTGYGWAVDAMSPGTAREILRNPWSGEHYSRRIWKNQQALAQWLEEDLTAGMLAGRSSKVLACEMAERMGVGFREAERLVRTETCYMANAAEMQSYREAGITCYRFLATLDNRTSEICGELDGQVFDVAEAVPGKNMPPLHPNCRSTTVAVIDGGAVEGLKRRATRPDGTTELVPADMTYKVWREKYTYVIPTGNDKLNLPSQMTQLQREKYLSALENEPKITKDLQRIITDMGGELTGLEFRLKTPESFMRKISTDMLKEGLDERNAISSIYDTIRYTSIASPETLADVYLGTVDKFAQEGYSLRRVKNTWMNPESAYKGVILITIKECINQVLPMSDRLNTLLVQHQGLYRGAKLINNQRKGWEQ